MKMMGDLAVRCHYGCCRVYGHKTGKGYRDERRHIKRSERNKWKIDVRKYLS